MSDIKKELELIQLRSENQELRNRLNGQRQIIQAAICAVCGEEIGESEIGLHEETERLCHLACCEVGEDGPEAT